MDYYIHQQRENFYKDDMTRPNFQADNDKKMEQFTIQKIELYIQQQVKRTMNNTDFFFVYNYFL